MDRTEAVHTKFEPNSKATTPRQCVRFVSLTFLPVSLCLHDCVGCYLHVASRNKPNCQSHIFTYCTDRIAQSVSPLGYYLDNLGVVARFPAVTRDFILLQTVQIGSGSHTACHSINTRIFSSGVKRPECKGDLLFPSKLKFRLLRQCVIMYFRKL